MVDRDFTVATYHELIQAFISADYTFQPYHAFIQNTNDKAVILRHDVDRLPLNALRFAELEESHGINATYFFRIVKESFNPSVIKAIHQMGHEIGYHYEDMDLAKGNVEKAYRSFQQNLATLRKLVPINTVCMHGSPLSKFDNRAMWDVYDYRNDGIIGEPYFDVDYNDVFYITDTGRKWNDESASIRDKVKSGFNFRVNSTKHLIEMIKAGKMPDKLMINTHPQRWNDEWGMWMKELVGQTVKNQVKRVVAGRSRG